MENPTLTAIEKRRIRQNANYHAKKDLINAKRRAVYLAKTVVIIPEPEWRFKTYDEVFAGLTEQHKKTTNYHLQSAFKILGTDNFEKTIQNADEVIAKFREADINANSKKVYFQSLLIGKTDNEIIVSNDALHKYTAYFSELKLDAFDISKRKQATEIIPEFGHFLELVKSKFGEYSREYLLIWLYSELTARDNYYLAIVPSLKMTENPEQNFMVIPKNVKQPCTVVLNKFKTDGIYPAMIQKLTMELSMGFRRYILNAKLDYGDYLFNKKNGEMVARIFNAVGYPNKTINTLRQMRVSQNVEMTNGEKSQLATNMMHSTNVQGRYVRTLDK